MTCLNFQFSEDAEFSQAGEPIPCKNGFHFCENPLDVFEYYPPDGSNVYAIVEARGKVVKELNKSATNKIFIKKKVSLNRMFKYGFEEVVKLCKASIKSKTPNQEGHVNTSTHNSHASTSGYNSHSMTSGDESHAMTSGDESHAVTSGNFSHANTSGDSSHANTSGGLSNAHTSGNESHANTSEELSHAHTSGSSSHANTSGYHSNASTSGNESHASTSGVGSHASTSGVYSHANTSGDHSYAITLGNDSNAITKGRNSIACALGLNSKAMCGKSGLIVLIKYDDKGLPLGGVVAKVGDVISGVKIKPNVFYYFDGEELICDESIK